MNHLPIAERIRLAIESGNKEEIQLALEDLAPRGNYGRGQPPAVLAAYDRANRAADALVDQNKRRNL